MPQFDTMLSFLSLVSLLVGKKTKYKYIGLPLIAYLSTKEKWSDLMKRI